MSRDALCKACETCLKGKDVPKPLAVVCEMIRTLCKEQHAVEMHGCVNACRDMASRCGVEACKQKARGWRGRAQCCFRMCDACDNFCHQRCSLPKALAGNRPLLCAFNTGPRIPGTERYVPPSKLGSGTYVVYCASTSCGAGPQYCHRAASGAVCLEYPGGLLEYACRCECDDQLKKMKKAEHDACLRMDFNHCGKGPHQCYP